MIVGIAAQLVGIPLIMNNGHEQLTETGMQRWKCWESMLMRGRFPILFGHPYHM